VSRNPAVGYFRDVRECCLTAVQDEARLLEEDRHFERWLTANCSSIDDVCSSSRSKRYRDILIAKEPLGCDRGYRVLLNDLVSRSVEVHPYRDLIRGFARQLHAANGPAVHAAYPNVRPGVQANDAAKMRIQPIRRGKQILPSANDEDS
jgi:hypothetical protein